MIGYLPMDRKERREMLASVGVDLDQLFSMIPECDCIQVDAFEALREEGMSEMDVVDRVKALAAKNLNSECYDSYLGAGYYDHYQPSAVHHLINRSEFLTSYTPYQPEISQGTLQAIFEWQSYITRLTGLPVSNASLYDAASGAAEAMLLACRDKRRYKVFVSEGVHPDTIETIHTYCHAADIEVVMGEVDANGQTTVFPEQEKEYACYLLQSPNFFGIVEDLDLLADKAHQADALAAVSQDPVSLAMLKRPGDSGVDIAVGEAQSLGLPTSYGGPGVGYMAVTERLMRKMPGRICGATVDRNGRTSYVLTLQAREQHIRRERATSNICTSQALMATAATIWLALQGSAGLLDVAEQSAAKAIYLEKKLTEGGVFKRVYDSPYFREFLVEAKQGIDLRKLNAALLEEGIIGGLVLPKNRMLIAVTEKKTKEQLDCFAKTVLRLCNEQGGK
ncbi:MAG TPA: aminomethyl-transferring glycine dehydrogenase subunit GcvPA [Clostridia bacterium]|nr:aminomethyl-transferring glycine dehydrogenase subunit GcvPA [Clostridia bacterium]